MSFRAQSCLSRTTGYLIDALATQIWEIDEAKGILRTFKGSYSQYHVQREAEQAAEKQASGSNLRVIRAHSQTSGIS